MEWISVKDEKPKTHPENEDESIEVEIAYWDGVLMCRTFGAYDYSESAWYSYGFPFHEDFIVTHWAAPRDLPEPLKQ